jgi:LemA protein
MSTAILFWGPVLILLVYVVFVYNSLVQIKHNVAKAWSNIDVLLKQRHDELPKLIETCKQYKQFEQDTLRQVTEARSRVQQASIFPRWGWRKARCAWVWGKFLWWRRRIRNCARMNISRN